MELTPTERALAQLVADLRSGLVGIMVEATDDHARALARAADKLADYALRDLPRNVRRAAGERP